MIISSPTMSTNAVIISVKSFAGIFRTSRHRTTSSAMAIATSNTLTIGDWKDWAMFCWKRSILARGLFAEFEVLYCQADHNNIGSLKALAETVDFTILDNFLLALDTDPYRRVYSLAGLRQAPRLL
jgi:hypothetical protein